MEIGLGRVPTEEEGGEDDSLPLQSGGGGPREEEGERSLEIRPWGSTVERIGAEREPPQPILGTEEHAPQKILYLVHF